MTPWKVKLTGNESDLDALVELNAGPECRVTKEDGTYYLSCAEWREMQDANEVYAAAKDAQLPFINALLKLRDAEAQPISLDSVIQMNADGSKTIARHVFSSAALGGHSRITVKGVVIAPDGTVVPSPEPAIFQARLRLVRDHAEVRHALAYWLACDAAAPTFWVNAYKVFEIIREDMARGRGRGKGTDEIKARGWATQHQIRNFKASANNQAISGEKARHAGHQPVEEGIVPVREQEAKDFIRHLLETWLDWKVTQ